MEFYDIALAKLLQTLPELGNYLVTFKDASEELQGDTDIKVGIFVLKAGAEYMYVPAVAKGDNVYPIDSIFFASSSKFFPLTKKTLRMIETQSQLTQGVPTKIPKQVVTNPDLTQLITPPRTGKYVYASSSRLGDFLHSMPDHLKQFTLSKIASEHSMYEGLHQLFNLKDILDHFKKAPGSIAAEVNKAPVSILTSATQRLDEAEIREILDHGYAVSGKPLVNRVAVSSQDFNTSGTFKTLSNLDGGSDYEIMLRSGNSREAFIPKSLVPSKPKHAPGLFALFTNGDYAITHREMIHVGDTLDRKTVLTTVFDFNPPVLPKDLVNGEKFVILSTDAELIGAFTARSITINNLGIEIRATQMGSYKEMHIFAYRNFTNSFAYEGHDLYIPYNSLVLRLGKDITESLEVNINAATKKREINSIGSLLGGQISLGYDGIEFALNGRPIPNEAGVMEVLVVREHINPDKAKSFVKQAKDNGFTRIYMSKAAADEGFAPAEIPSYGNVPPNVPKTGLNGSFVPNVQTAMQTNDAQAVETTIISELLQAPDMFELIQEYMPDIEECIDRLGRILLLSRVHIDRLAESGDADNVFAFLASLKAVYRMLGDNYSKLQEMITVRPDVSASTEK